MCVHVYLFIYYKELAYTIIEAGKAKICRMGQQVEDMIQSECCPLAEFSAAWKRPIFCAVQDFSCLDKAHPL